MLLQNSQYIFTIFIYFWLRWVFAVVQVFLVVKSGGYSLAAAHGLLIAVASLVVALRL